MTTPTTAPWLPTGAAFVATGRQALALVAADLRRQGIREVVTAAYGCVAAWEPFHLEGLAVRRLPLGADLLLEPSALAQALDAAGGPIAVLHTRTFGASAGPALREVLERARALGHRVVADDTHAVLSDGPDATADDRVASFRKLLPVPEAASAVGIAAARSRLVSPRTADAEALSAAGWEVHRLESSGRAGARCADPRGVDPAYLAAYERYEELVTAARVPCAPGARALTALDALDPVAVREAWEASATAVRAVARDLGLAVVPGTDDPFVVVRDPRAPELAEALLGAGLYPLVWWPRPRGWPPGAEWPDDLLVLPTDPGYGPGLARRVRAALVGVLSGGGRLSPRS